ncbi:hypothetical protein OQI87_08150 [Lactobacillus kefiranofaciens]|uniref:hypothetical protein n=1 Tax=Lactobacillus kefiranofaciens TaxID=267818 RepID=UPI0024690E87|nr:hypothetical protein [Lactobacillus kefiranofaciens]MDH5101061.1 hypothetical protein [Lactobacillus kefiranofaciens]
MKVIPKKYFLRIAKKYKKKHYDLTKVNKIVELIEAENFKELKEKHKLGVIHGTHPLLYHVHVDRSYNDDWLLFYTTRLACIVLLILVLSLLLVKESNDH